MVCLAGHENIAKTTKHLNQKETSDPVNGRNLVLLQSSQDYYIYIYIYIYTYTCIGIGKDITNIFKTDPTGVSPRVSPKRPRPSWNIFKKRHYFARYLFGNLFDTLGGPRDTLGTLLARSLSETC